MSGLRAQGRDDPWRLASSLVLLVLVIVVPPAFDTGTFDVFNVTKFTIVVCAGLVLGTLALGARIARGRTRAWRNGLQWPVLAVVAWTAVTTAASTNVRVSVLGFYHSYDGLLTAAAMAVIFFALVDAFPAPRLPALLSAMYFGGGGLVAAYGMAQLHDLTLDRRDWDWVEWADAPWRDTAIWSSLGNPAHLGGFIALLLPLGIALALCLRRVWARVAAAALACALVPELIATTTRGAWLGAVSGVAVLCLLLSPEVRRAPAVATAVAAVATAGAIALALVLRSSFDASFGVGWLVDLGEGTSGAQRIELWRAALQMGVDRPVFGFGPDTFRIPFPAYQTAEFVDLYGPDRVANGAHNMFMNVLATQGFPGVLALVALIAFAGVRAAGSWRRLRVLERIPGGDRDGRAARILLAGVVGGLTAYLVQAMANVQQVALSFCFWTLLAALCSISLAAGVPDTLHPTRLLRVREESSRGLERQRPAASSGLRVILTASALALVLALGVWQATRPIRADREYAAALELERAALIAALEPPGRRPLARASARLDTAVRTNPWEAEYLVTAARVRLASALERPGRARRLLTQARRLYERAARLQPRDAAIQAGYATALLRVEKLEPRDLTARREAVAALRAAVASNPWQPRYAVTLAMVLERGGDEVAALAVLQRALGYRPHDPQLLTAASNLLRVR